MNHKRVERIWRREGLKVPQRQPKRSRLWLNDGSCIRLRPEYPGHVWAYDFVEARTHDGRKLRVLIVRRDAERAQAQDAYERETQGNMGAADLARSRLQLVRTAAETLALERRLIELSYSQAEADAQNIMATNAVGSAKYQEAQARLALLTRLKANDLEASDLRNASPGMAFLNSIPTKAAEIEEYLEGLSAGALADLNSDLADALTGVSSLGDAFTDLSRSIIRDLARIAIQQAIIKPIAESLFGSGGGGGNVFGSLAKIFGSGGPGYGGAKALGGPVDAGRSYLVGENGPERFVPRVAGQNLSNSMPIPRITTPAAATGPAPITIHIDAKSAELGVEEKIAEAIARAAPQIAPQGVTPPSIR